jgi:ribosomal protein L3
MILSKYSSVKGLKYLSQNGLNRLTNGTASCSPDKNDTTKSAVLNNNTTTSDTNSQTVKKEPFDNDKYRHGKTDPLYILSVGEEVNIEFDGIKGLGASDPDVAEIKPTTSNLKIIGKKVGFVEIMIKDNTGKENHINVNVVDSTSNKIDNIYMIKKESKKIYISNIEKIAADNDNIELSAKDKTVSIKAKKEGNITLTLMRKDGTKVDVTIKVLKPYEKKMAISLKSLETKDIKFDQISSISITTHGIVDVKQESKIIKITGTSKGKTFVIVYGKDNSQLKLDVTVE